VTVDIYPVATERLESEATRLAQSTSTVSRFSERFRDGQYSLVSFLFAARLPTVSPCPAICKGAAGAPVLYVVGATVFVRVILKGN